MAINPKLKKITTDIEKTRDKISDLQVKLRELEQQKTEVENTEILALFRSVAVTPDELAGFIQKYKAESVGQAAAVAEPPKAEPMPAMASGALADDEEENVDDNED